MNDTFHFEADQCSCRSVSLLIYGFAMAVTLWSMVIVGSMIC